MEERLQSFEAPLVLGEIYRNEENKTEYSTSRTGFTRVEILHRKNKRVQI